MTGKTRLNFTFIRTLPVLLILSYRLAFLLASGNLSSFPDHLTFLHLIILLLTVGEKNSYTA